MTDLGELSQERRTLNEQLFRRENMQRKAVAQKVVDKDSQAFLPIAFACECSDSKCRAKVELPIDDFVLAHQYTDRFIVLPGHEQPDIEKVVDSDKRHGYLIVEKHLIEG